MSHRLKTKEVKGEERHDTVLKKGVDNSRITPLTFEYRSSIWNSKVTVPSAEASMSLTFSIICRSKPVKSVALAMSR